MQTVRRPARRRVNGVLFIDKPPGMTSNGVLGALKRFYNADKAGHTGTLDPFATGLLPVAMGEATKFSGHLLDADKTYLATMQLGITTTTGDPEGEVLAVRPVQADAAAIDAALGKFCGEIDQVPPMYSALKRDGKPLYEYARAGVTLERAARRVTIHSLELVMRQGDAVQFRVACSKGTYVRTLAEDIGNALGCGAHLIALRRERSGPFSLDGAVSLAQIESLAEADRDALLRPIDALIAHLPLVKVDNAQATRLRLGQRLAMHALGLTAAGLYRVYDEQGALTGLVQAIDGAVRPERIVAQGSPA
jgi:tRNA pseudouridine55 synthase